MNYISEFGKGTRVQESWGGCRGLGLSRAWGGMAPRLLHTLIMFGVRADGRGRGSPLSACLHVCCCTGVFTVSPRVREGWKTNEVLLFFSLALSHVSLALQRRAAGGWGAGDDRLVIYSAFHICLLVLSFPPLSSNHFPAVICSLSCLRETGA